MGNVEYSPKALEDLQKLKAYSIENFGVDAAQKALAKITGSVRRLEEYPALGVVLGRMIMEKYGIIFSGVIRMQAIKDIISKRDQIISIASHYKMFNVKLFGSVLREEENAESDIDFLN